MVERQKTFCNRETKRIYSERDVMSLEALYVLIVAKTLVTLCRIE